MVSFFENALLPLVRLGVIDILVFLLVLTIIYVLLQKTNILGKKENGRKINSIIALSTALMFINLVPGEVFVGYLMWFAIFFVGAISLLLILSFTKVEPNVIKYSGLGIFLITILFVVAQLIKSNEIMKLILAFGVIFLVATSLLGKRWLFFSSIGANIVLIIMAITLDMKNAVEDVYLNGISIIMITFALLMAWFMSGVEKVDKEVSEREEKGSKKKEEKKSEKQAEKQSKEEKQEPSKEHIPSREEELDESLEKLARKRKYGVRKVKDISEDDIYSSREDRDIYREG